MEEAIWWNVRVFDEETRTFTTLSKHGTIPGIMAELKEDGYWVFVSATPERSN